LYAAGAFVSVRFMAAVFGTSSGVPGKRVISPVDQPEHSRLPSFGHDGGGYWNAYSL
jgi:hypothetical protein